MGRAGKEENNSLHLQTHTQHFMIKSGFEKHTVRLKSTLPLKTSVKSRKNLVIDGRYPEKKRLLHAVRTIIASDTYRQIRYAPFQRVRSFLFLHTARYSSSNVIRWSQSTTVTAAANKTNLVQPTTQSMVWEVYQIDNG